MRKGMLGRMRLWLMAMLLLWPLTGQAADSSSQGAVSLTSTEKSLLARMGQDKHSDAGRVIGKILRDADKALATSPQPFAQVITSGQTAKGGGDSNSKEADHEAAAVWTLALAYAASGQSAYAGQAERYLLAWSQINQPSGDSVAETKFVPMFRAYDLLHDAFSPNERVQIDRWMTGIAEAVITDQEKARAKGIPRGINNHRSHALLIIGTIGAVLGERRFIDYAKQNYRDHIRENLQTYPGEPEGFGYDYHQRKALHYVAYNLRALGQLAMLLDRLHVGYNPYTVDAGGASLIKTLRSFLPYAAGEKQSMHEFEGTLDANDLKRLQSGSLKTQFERRDAVPALEAAAYFFPTVEHYDLAAIVANIERESKGELSLPMALPTPAFLIDRITSPYR